MPATYEPIATTTLGSAAATITFSSIPGTYTDLKLIFVPIIPSVDSYPVVRFNDVSSTDYSSTILSGYGSGLTNDSINNATYVTDGTYFRCTSSAPTLLQYDIFSYSGSTDKTTLISGSADRNGAGSVGRVVNLFRSTAAITKITITELNSNNWGIGTTATLYGILKA